MGVSNSFIRVQEKAEQCYQETQQMFINILPKLSESAWELLSKLFTLNVFYNVSTRTYFATQDFHTA